MKNTILSAALVILAIAGLNLRHTAAQADGGPIVTIGAPVPLQVTIPVPLQVTGSATVSGNVNATQHGDWNVGILGQPIRVNVDNSPTVSVRNLDEPGRAPYEEQRQEFISAGECASGNCVHGFTFNPVPANKRLVIKEVSGLISLTQNGTVFGLQLGPLFLPMSVQTNTSSGSEWLTNQTVNHYVDANNRPFIQVVVDQAHVDFSKGQAITLSGYYVTLP